MTGPRPDGGPPSPAPRSDRPRFLVYWLPAIAYVGVIFALSSIRGGGTPWKYPHVDKLAHLLEYSLLGLLLGRAIRHTMIGSRRWVAALATVGLGAVVAFLDELYQSRVPRRDSSAADWATDVLALALAVLLTQIVAVRPFGRRKRASRAEPGAAESNSTENRIS